MNYKYYTIVENESDLKLLILILKKHFNNDIFTKEHESLIINKFINKKKIMICIENKRISYNDHDYITYAKANQLEQISVKDIILQW